MESRKPSRLSRIKTRWTMVFQAHGGNPDAVAAAQNWLLMRYYRSVFRYLRAMVGDADVAEELTNDFAVRFLRGDFKQAQPSRGRFRSLLKRALRNLAIDYWRHQNTEKKVRPSDDLSNVPAQAADVIESDRIFLEGWRAEIMAQASRALKRFDDRTGRCYQTILHYKAANPKKRSAELAKQFKTRSGRRLTETAFRQLLHRARDKFAELLVAEVARSLRSTDPNVIEAELIDLGLIEYCRKTMVRLRETNFLHLDRP